MNPRSLSESRVQKPKLKRRFREETAQAMLGAAELVFAERGLHEASMAAIAGRAGVAVGTLYNHFKDRESLLEGLLALRRAELKDRLERSQSSTAGEPFQRQLAALLHALFDHFEAHKPFLTIVMQDEQAIALKKPNETLREIHRHLERLVKRGVREGLLRISSGDLYPTMLLGLVRGLCLRELQFGGHGKLVDHIDETIEFFLRGAGR
jgi:AcrR family transcriptional regulator